jgi:YaiO family outer membrane protein
MHLRTALLLCLAVALAHTPGAAGQTTDVLASARTAIADGRRADALVALNAHLRESPRDVDARFLYGAILSWEGRYEEASSELRRVLAQAPAYREARVALMNVEWWSGRTSEARDAADAILADDPGNPQARALRDRLEAASRPWSAGFSYATDQFNGDRQPWHEFSASVSRLTPRGSVIVRASEAKRFGLGDRLVEVEFYPRIRPGTYAFIAVGGAPDATLYPDHRIAFDLYQSIGHGIEVSGGLRRLGFATTTTIYVGTVSQYRGNWLLTGKVFHVPGEGRLDSTSIHAGFRRYVRGDGISTIGAAYSHGSSREEIRNAADLATLGADTVRAEFNQRLGRRLQLFATVGTSRQERPASGALWQTSITSGFTVGL